jgi:hypothetical protein
MRGTRSGREPRRRSKVCLLLELGSNEALPTTGRRRWLEGTDAIVLIVLDVALIEWVVRRA